MAEQEILALPLSNGDEGVFLAKKSGGIYRAIMDNSNSTATAFVLTCDDISSLYDGIMITCKNTKVASATNCTINLNGLGAKRIWLSQSNSYCTTHWALNQTYLFIYDAANERWELQQGRDTDGNDTYTVRPYYSHPTAGVNGIKQYSLFARTADGKYTSFTTDSGVGTKTFDTETYYDIRKIFYYNGSGNVAADAIIGNNTMTYSVILFDCRYTLNGVTTSTSTSALVANKPLYLIFNKEDNKYGCFKLKSPFWTQDPTTLEDNGSNIYVLVGYVYDPYRCDLFVDNPAFHRVYGSVGNGQLFPYTSANDINGKAVNADVYTGEPLVYCNASGSDRIKVAKCEGFAGDGNSPCYIFVHMEESNTYDGAIALQINDQDYFPIWINGAASSEDNGELPSGLYFVYFDGTHYHFNVGATAQIGGITAPVVRGGTNNRLALAAALVTITGASSATGIKFDGYGGGSGNICQVIQTSLHGDNQTVLVKGNKILTRANDYYIGNVNGTSSTLPTIHVSNNADVATITFDANGNVYINGKKVLTEA
jgi:hypothetical protein